MPEACSNVSNPGYIWTKFKRQPKSLLVVAVQRIRQEVPCLCSQQNRLLWYTWPDSAHHRAHHSAHHRTSLQVNSMAHLTQMGPSRAAIEPLLPGQCPSHSASPQKSSYNRTPASRSLPQCWVEGAGWPQRRQVACDSDKEMTDFVKYISISDTLMMMRPGWLPEALSLPNRFHKAPASFVISWYPGGKGDLLIMNTFSSKLRHFIRKVSLGWDLSK